MRLAGRAQDHPMPRTVGAATDGGIDMPPASLPCPAGCQIGPPDFVGVGVQRCGTTRWFDLIRSHPEIAPAQGLRSGYSTTTAKELHYFDRFYAGGCSSDELARYQEYFPRAAGQKAGEWTPLYASAPWIPALLAAAAPDARLLMIVRDPVERLISALALNARTADKRGAPLSRYAPLEAFSRGFYHLQLTGLLRHFRRSQILLLQYERCSADPMTELRRTFEFIGVSDLGFAPPHLDATPQRQPEKPALDDDLRVAYAQAYSEDVARLLNECPEIDARMWPNFAHLV
jgi:Sulfotransferase domain